MREKTEESPKKEKKRKQTNMSAFAVYQQRQNKSASDEALSVQPTGDNASFSGIKSKRIHEKRQGNNAIGLFEEPDYKLGKLSAKAMVRKRKKAKRKELNIIISQQPKTFKDGIDEIRKSLAEADVIPFKLSQEQSKKKSVIGSAQRKKVMKKDSFSQKIKRNKISISEQGMSGEKCFEWLIHPFDKEKFMREMWEKKPLLIRRNNPEYYSGVFSAAELDSILRKENVQFTKNLDVTTYTPEGGRDTLNPVGRAHGAVVWDFFLNGCSIRLLNPQTFSHGVWKLLTTLQEYFHSCVGANVYLTPGGFQGFAPHWDDIEAFVLQLEGQKSWKVYAPRNENEKLPLHSSKNFKQDEIGEPILEAVLQPGDLLYFPRGFIHQASTPEKAKHSLHITVSCAQRNTWGDLLKKMLEGAVEMAMEEDASLRESLPVNYFTSAGIVWSETDTPSRKAFLDRVASAMRTVMQHAPVDSAVDQVAKGFVHDSLPPVLSEDDLACSVYGTGEKWSAAKQKVVRRVELDPDTNIRLLRVSAIRLVMEEGAVRLYHSVDNPRIYHGDDIQFFEMSPEEAPALESLIHSFPEFVKVEDLPLPTISEKMQFACALWEKGLIRSDQPPSRLQ